jgi:DNA-binding MarR family transcriptional regulator
MSDAKDPNDTKDANYANDTKDAKDPKCEKDPKHAKGTKDIKKEIIERLTRLQGMLHRRQAQTFTNFGPWGTPQRGQGRVLSILKMKPEISQKELSYLLDMSKQALAEILNKLERNGFIEREPSEADRRSVIIRLTEKGAAAAADMEGAPTDLESMLDGFDDEELANLSDYLRRMAERLDGQLGENGADLRKQMMERFMEWHGSAFGGRDGFHGDFQGRFGPAHGHFGFHYGHKRGGRRDGDPSGGGGGRGGRG